MSLRSLLEEKKIPLTTMHHKALLRVHLENGHKFRLEEVLGLLGLLENIGTAVAIRGKDGVVFAVEKIMTSKLYEKGANRRIFNIDTHIGMAAAGLVTDARQLTSIARDEVRNKCDQSYKQQIVTCDYLQASSYRQDYGSSVPLPQLIQRVSSYMHDVTLYSSPSESLP